MSRYGFTKFDAEVVVGWDNPLQTLFGDVENAEGDTIVSTMMDMGKTDIQTVDMLEVMLGHVIPDHLRARLEEDMANSTSPTALQAAVGKVFEGIKR